jgi:hypothetical protein
MAFARQSARSKDKSTDKAQVTSRIDIACNLPIEEDFMAIAATETMAAVAR